MGEDQEEEGAEGEEVEEALAKPQLKKRKAKTHPIAQPKAKKTTKPSAKKPTTPATRATTRATTQKAKK